MPPSAFVADALRALQTSAALPLPLLPELSLFALGEKSALRYVGATSVTRALEAAARAHGYDAALCGVALVEEGQGWWRLESSAQQTDDDTSASASMVLLTTARAGASAERLLSLELAGGAHEAGAALGYPPCCVAAYDALAQRGDRWPQELLARSGPGPYPAWANRLANAVGATSPAGELFPCSLRCDAAIALGRRGDHALRALGLARLADMILRLACRPLRVDDDAVALASSEPDANATFYADESP